MTASVLEEYAARAVDAYHQLCTTEGTDPDLELATARLAHGLHAWQWIAARLWYAHDKTTRPKSRTTWTDAEAGYYAYRAFTGQKLPDVVALVAVHADPETQLIAARRARNPDLILALVDHPDTGVAAAAVAADQTPLDKLVTRPDLRPHVRAALALHSKLTAAHIDQLTHDPAWQVRASIARHPRVGAERLDRLANDPHPAVRDSVTSHSRARISTLRRLANDPIDLVATHAARQLDTLIAHRELRARKGRVGVR